MKNWDNYLTCKYRRITCIITVFFCNFVFILQSIHMYMIHIRIALTTFLSFNRKVFLYIFIFLQNNIVIYMCNNMIYYSIFIDVLHQLTIVNTIIIRQYWITRTMKKNITNITIQKTLMIRYEVNIEVMKYRNFLQKFMILSNIV